MSTPPRRRRTERRPQSDGVGGWLPTIGMGLGVIVAGLGIGALVAVLMQRTPPPKSPVVVATSTSIAPSRPPIALATFVPPRTPRPTPRRTLQVAAAPAPTTAPTPTAEPTAPAEPTSPAGPTATPTPAPTAFPSSAPAVTTAPSPRVTPTRPAPTPEPVVQSSTTPIGAPPGGSSPSASSANASAPGASAPGASLAGTSTYEDRASAVVRRYVDALIRGDDKTAYAALGANGRTAGGTLTEQSFLDSSARIVSIKVTRIDAANASVGCEITSAKGRYYATYHVTAASDGPYISEHDYIKV